MKRVVVIGGGFAGVRVAKELQHDFLLTLIDTTDFFEFTPGILRTLVEPKHVKKIHAPHAMYLRGAKRVLGVVTRMTAAAVYVGKKKIPYEYCVLAAGSSYNAPIKQQEVVQVTRGKHLAAAHGRVHQARHILIVGGGLVGVELAAELVTHDPAKITLVHAHEQLMERNAPRAQAYARRFLEKRGVQLVFNERVLKKKAGFYITDKGRKIAADVVFFCTGITPNTKFVPKEWKDAKGIVRVNQYLQVQGMENVFAPGDVNDAKVEKTAQNAVWQARIVVQNIRRLERKRQLMVYHERKTPMVVSLGKWDGIAQIREKVFCGFFPGIFKAAIEWWEMLRVRYF